eukprot:m.697664 g.697664  ORF g.697664 m.697664 type:complete len:57 (+) comp22897_c0_seq40:302-472(+)
MVNNTRVNHATEKEEATDTGATGVNSMCTGDLHMHSEWYVFGYSVDPVRDSSQEIQ